MLLSIVTPALNEDGNLAPLYRDICRALDTAGVEWEWIIVDDGSSDKTYVVVGDLCAADTRVRGVRLSRNFGSHAAALCGFDAARGGRVILMAGDGQDPPAEIPAMLSRMDAGSDVVWAVRAVREGEGIFNRIMSRAYHAWINRLPGLERLPSEGADFVLVSRRVVDVLKTVSERNVSILATISWLGFRHDHIRYVKKARLSGRSNWTFSKKIKLFLDSMVAYSYVPMRAILFLGLLIATVGFVYALVVFVAGLRGTPLPGWSSTMIAVLVLGGTQMVMIGVIGQYLWRTLDEIRGRPRYVVERSTDDDADEGVERSPRQGS